MRYSQARSDLFQPGPLPAPAVGGTISGPSTQPAHQAVLNEEHIFSPTTVNSFRAGFSRIDINAQDENGGVALANEVGIPGSNVAGNPLTNGLPVIAVTGAATLGTAGNVPAIIRQQQFPIRRYAQHSARPPHDSDRRGADAPAVQRVPNPERARHAHIHHRLFAKPGAFLRFVFFALLLRHLNRRHGHRAGRPAAGAPLSGSLATVDGMRGLRRTDLSTFVQDDFKMTSRLTVNLGLRYENYLGWPWTEVDNRGYNFLPSKGTLAQLGTNGVPASGVRANNLNFMPRVGFAYQADPRTVVRAAYGIFYNDPQIIFGNSVENNAPEAISYAFTNNQYNFASARPASAGFVRTSNHLPRALLHRSRCADAL